MPPSPPNGDLPLDFAAISTHASVLRDGNLLYRRYSDAILAYALRLLRNHADAEEVLLAVAEGMAEGRFSQAAVAKGRFRRYIQRAVRHAALNLKRKRARERGLLQRLWDRVRRPGRAEAPSVEDEFTEADTEIWREAVLGRALGALEEYERGRQEQTHPNVYHTLARLLADHPGDDSEQLARRLGERAGGEYNAGQLRGIVLRMRKKLAELLVAEVVPQLDDPGYDAVLEELRDLGLLAYVGPYLPAREAPDGA
jgi:DNA-directed RNA polymerase specialized sigma24 family protein